MQIRICCALRTEEVAGTLESNVEQKIISSSVGTEAVLAVQAIAARSPFDDWD
jgi:hypothetical protein